jgi:hypothetical protein
MYRFRVPEIFLGCFLTVAVFATGMLFERQKQATNPTNSEKKQEAATNSYEPENPDAELTGSPWLTKDAAGFFTFGLVVIGVGQAILFYIQLRYMREGMRDAADAAQAANTAATAAKEQVEVAKAQIEVTRMGVFDLERAYLDVEPTDIKTQFVLAPASFQPINPMEIVAKVGIKNSGRTRAVISQVYGEFRTGTWLGARPSYDFSKGTNYPTDLSLGAGEHGDFFHDFRTQEVTEQFFVGFIVYADIFKRPHTARFCARIFPSPDNGGDAKRQLAGSEAWREWD